MSPSSPQSSYRLYRRMLGFVRPYWYIFVLSALMSIAIVAFDALSLWISATLFGTIFGGELVEVTRPPFALSNLNEMLKYWTWRVVRAPTRLDSLRIVCVLMVTTFLLKNILTYLQSLVVAALNLRVVRDMRNRLYAHVLALPVSFFDRTRSGKVVSLVVNDVSIINSSLTNTLNHLLLDPVRLIAFLTILLIISPFFTLMVFIIYPVLGFAIVRIGKAVRRRSRRALDAFSGVLSVLHETLGGIRAVKMFNMNRVETEKFSVENRAFVRTSFRSTQASAIPGPLTETLGVGVTVLLLWFGGRTVLAGGGISAEDFVRYLIVLVSSYQPLKQLGRISGIVQNGMAAAGRVFELLDTPTESLAKPCASRTPSFQREIRFEQVWFTYPGCNETVLSAVSFRVKKGEIVALVGSSGSGKSTILDLLPRLYPVVRGGIYLDDTNIADCDLVGLRSLFGVVAQETVLFNDTVANNIAYGAVNPGNGPIEAAARAANAWEFIQELPAGLQTVIGEKGVTLSGGQRQRLAIARALLKNPPVLILDEATSSLDTESERLVQSAIDTLMEKRTALIVAHRLSTILHADRILVLERGHIIEQGTHRELLQHGARYKQLYDIQFGVEQERCDCGI